MTKILNRLQGGDCSVYLFLDDFANFKLINYTYGFERGDELLNKTVQFIRHIPGCVICERMAMDQFIFVIVTKTLRTEAEIIAAHNEWIETFLATQRDNYAACTLRVWCGVYEVRDWDIATAIDNANWACREAKTTGSLSAVLFKRSMLEKLFKQQLQETVFSQLLKEGRFTFYLQPQVDLNTGKIVGAEALARGFFPNGEMIAPDVFIPILEKNGLILNLDYLILEQVCRHIRERMDNGKPVIQISVNLSRLHLKRQETAVYIHNIVKKYKIPPEFFMFELTESIMLDDFAGAKSLCVNLRRFGYKISVDDFGSGYAGIDVWRNLSFDELKLDKSFFAEDPETKQRNEIIVSGIVGIAQKLKISVICEGIEHAQQCRNLLAAGCQMAQGSYFSKPLPVIDFYTMYHNLHGIYFLEYNKQKKQL